MPSTAPKISGSEHPISITKTPKRVRVLWRGAVIADSLSALDLKEAAYPAVKYIPRGDVDMRLVHKSAHHTVCPYKGEASYFTIRVNGETAENAAWSYETPHPAVIEIKDHLAFYPNRVDRIDEIND